MHGARDSGRVVRQFKKYLSPKTFEERIETELIGLLGVILTFSVTGLYMLVLLIKYGLIIFAKQKFLFCWLLVQGVGCLAIAVISLDFHSSMKKAKSFAAVRIIKLKFYKFWFICFVIPYLAMIVWLALHRELLDMICMLSILVLCFVLLYFSDWRRFQKQASQVSEDL